MNNFWKITDTCRKECDDMDQRVKRKLEITAAAFIMILFILGVIFEYSDRSRTKKEGVLVQIEVYGGENV